MGYLGQPLARLEDARLTSGQGRFIDDLRPLPNLHHAAILRSPYAHARIRSIRCDQALALPGVRAVVTGADAARWLKPFPVGVKVAAPYYPIAVDKVRYAGEPVAVVVADSRYTAEDALASIVVEYEPLPVVVDPELALSPEAPRLHEGLDSNLVHQRTFSYGDAARAFTEADVVIRHRFTFPKVHATPLETYGVIAHYQSSEDTYTVWSNFHGPFTLHSVMAAALQVPGNRLRVLVPQDVGGSYGNKSGVYPYMVLMAVVSRLAKVPVKWVEDRQEHLLASSTGTDRVTWIEAGFRRDGTLTGLRMRYIDNVGAYLRAPEPACLYRMHAALTGPYRVRDVEVEALAVVTNKCPTGLIRGYGGPQHCFPLERVMQMAAQELGLDAAEVVRRNLIRACEFPYTTPSGGVYDSGDYEQALARALERIDYAGWRQRQAEARAAGRYLGIGLACVVEPSGSNMGYIALAQTPAERERGLPKSGCAEAASVTVDPTGSVCVRFSTVPTGQGHETVAAQVVADALGIAPAAVRVITGMDSWTQPWTVASGSYSSRFAPIGANAVYRAAHQVREKLLQMAAHALGVPADALELRGGYAQVREQPDRRVSLQRLAGMAHWHPAGLPAGMEPGVSATAFFNLPTAQAPAADDTVNGSVTYGFVADAVLVEVDPETGRVQVLDYVTVHDAGRLLNPLLAEGQIRGGLACGLGQALYEELVYDATGQLLTGSFMDYLCPTSAELPPVQLDHIESPSPLTPLGAKGLGEGNVMSAPAALANAVADALEPLHVVIDKLPLTPAAVWQAIQAAKQRQPVEERVG
ncbi:MAG: xanthine dehydrogenase family protein molybdopterin-binding subunit [Alicyclobacillus sp.]|nr:xanthine dehydrogenase family protein molybdopterin-binding subunit [Alicyclobacillus sp.]